MITLAAIFALKLVGATALIFAAALGLWPLAAPWLWLVYEFLISSRRPASVPAISEAGSFSVKVTDEEMVEHLTTWRMR